METREQNIGFGKSGSGSTQSRIFLPSAWIKKMGFNENDRKSLLKFDENKLEITIEKVKEQ